MRRALLIMLAMVLVGFACQTPQKAPPAPAAGEKPAAVASEEKAAPAAPKAPVAPVPLEEYFKIERAYGASFSFDEKIIAYETDRGGRLNIWTMPVTGGEPVQITKVEGFVHAFAFSPTKDQLLYEADVGGNELPHLFLTDSTGKEHKDLCADYPEGARTGFVDWAKNGKTFLYLSSRRDPRFMDLLEYNLATGKSKTLWKASGKLAFALASRDHKRFIISETLSDVDSNMYLLKRGAKKPVLLTKHKGEILYTPTSFSKNGKMLYYTSDEGREFTALYSMNLRNKKSKEVLKTDWDVDRGFFSKSYRYFITRINEDGTFKVTVTDKTTGKTVEMPEIKSQGALYPISFSKSDRYMAAYILSDDVPIDIYMIDLKESKATRITNVLPDSLKNVKMVAGESVKIPSFDEHKVPAFVYRQTGKGPFPAVIDVHGGPTAQSLRLFNNFRQYLHSKGYVVLVPNVRGSTGYGKSYTKLDNLDLGGGPLKDIVHCKKWLVENADVDPGKVVVMGGSYGGYMALASATFTPDEFAANVDYFGPSDLKSLVESFPPYWASFATYIYAKFGDPKNPEHAKYQHDRSPLYYVDKITRPLLVVQGDNDARVKQDQSDRIVAALKERKVPVHYLVIKGEGHGFSKESNRLATYKVTDQFLDRYIFGDTSVRVDAQ